MFNERYGYYECSLCGHKSQVLMSIGLIDIYDADGFGIGQEEAFDVDTEASFILACEHEDIHK
jgi:hypothetical protein